MCHHFQMECYLACAAVVPVWMTESRGIICDLGDSKKNTPLSHGYHVHLRVHPLHMFVTAVIKIPEKKRYRRKDRFILAQFEGTVC